MHIDPRPMNVTVPSAATVARSPRTTWRSPSMVRNVDAVFSGSPW
jgi:hypothetical protein